MVPKPAQVQVPVPAARRARASRDGSETSTGRAYRTNVARLRHQPCEQVSTRSADARPAACRGTWAPRRRSRAINIHPVVRWDPVSRAGDQARRLRLARARPRRYAARCSLGAARASTRAIAIQSLFPHAALAAFGSPGWFLAPAAPACGSGVLAAVVGPGGAGAGGAGVTGPRGALELRGRGRWGARPLRGGVEDETCAPRGKKVWGKRRNILCGAPT